MLGKLHKSSQRGEATTITRAGEKGYDYYFQGIVIIGESINTVVEIESTKPRPIATMFDSQYPFTTDPYLMHAVCMIRKDVAWFIVWLIQIVWPSAAIRTEYENCGVRVCWLLNAYSV